MTFHWIPLLLAALVFLAPTAQAAGPYDPLALAQAAEASLEVLELGVRDEARGRDIALRVYLPSGHSGPSGPCPVVVFSHGLGGSRAGNGFMGRHWAGRGFVVVFVQHPGSDESVWKDKQRPLERLRALREAANAQNFLARVKDVSAVLDQLSR